MTTFIDWKDIEHNGKKRSTCPNCSHTRKNKTDKCLSINHDKGTAYCHHCEAVSFREEERDKLNDKDYTQINNDAFKGVLSEEKILSYISSRGISKSTLQSLYVSFERYYQPAKKKEVDNIVFNYYEKHNLVNKKFRSASKNFTQIQGAKPILYNINSLIGKKEAYIVEGEFDVLAMYEAGFRNVVSVPNGANDHDEYWLNSKTYLEDIEHFIIATDNDEKGIKLRENIAQRLGRYRCSYVEWNGKDANDDLLSGDLQNSIDNKKRFPVNGTFTIDDLYNGVLDLYNNGLPKTIYPKHECFGDLKTKFSVLRGQLNVVTGIPSHGKALDINTPIPTPNGFVKMKDLKVGDKVYDENGKTCNVIWKSEYWKNRPTYKLTFSDNSEIICDENHEWLTDDWQSRRSKLNAVKNKRDVDRDIKPRGTNQKHKRTFATIKTTKEISETLKTKADNRNNHSINLCKPINGVDNGLIINPYVLGCWLGDGNSADGGFTSNDIEVISEIKKYFNVTKRSVEYSYGIIGLKTKLRKLNLLMNKHIPERYLFASEKSRFELLRGLMDTDGHCNKAESRNEYCGTNYRLVKDVYSLVCSLGIKATFVEADATLNGKIISKKYRVFFKTNNEIYKIKRKQKRIDDYFKSGRKLRGNDVRYIINSELVDGYITQCIEVDSKSHLFLAGEQFIPTHNSNFVDWYVLNLINDYDMKASWFSPEHSPMELYQTNLMQKVIGKNFWSDKKGSRMSKREIAEYKEWAKQKIYLTDCTAGEYPTWDWLFEKFKEQMYSFGIDIFVIDAFNKVLMPSGDKLSKINEVLTKLVNFAQANNVIVFLVAHPTKMQKKEDGTYMMPTLYDVSGSADFRNQTHNGFTIYRHFGEEPRTEFINTKIKYNFQGEIGATLNFQYCNLNGRYYMDQEPLYNMITREEPKQLEIESDCPF